MDLVDEDGTFLDRANALSVQVEQRGADDRDQRRGERERRLAYTPDPRRGHRPGADTVSSYIVHWGDGSDRHLRQRRRQDAHLRRRPANHAITVDLVDEDGTFLNRANALSVTVNNVAPTIALQRRRNASNEGDVHTLSVTAPIRPGRTTRSRTSWTVNWGDGIVERSGRPRRQLAFLLLRATTATFTSNVRLTDGDGGADTGSTAVTVDNVAPTIAISGAADRERGLGYSLTLGAVTDPGTDTVTSYVVHWGDGITNTYGTSGVKTHTYADGPNDYDDHGGPGRRGRHAPRPRQRALGHVNNVAADDRDQRGGQRERGLRLQPDPGRGHRPGRRTR